MFKRQVKYSMLMCYNETVFFYLQDRILYMSDPCLISQAPLAAVFTWTCLAYDTEIGPGTDADGPLTLKNYLTLPKVDTRCADEYAEMRKGRKMHAVKAGPLWECVIPYSILIQN